MRLPLVFALIYMCALCQGMLVRTALHIPLRSIQLDRAALFRTIDTVIEVTGATVESVSVSVTVPLSQVEEDAKRHTSECARRTLRDVAAIHAALDGLNQCRYFQRLAALRDEQNQLLDAEVAKAVQGFANCTLSDDRLACMTADMSAVHDRRSQIAARINSMARRIVLDSTGCLYRMADALSANVTQVRFNWQKCHNL